jgi:hypothetical protein
MKIQIEIIAPHTEPRRELTKLVLPLPYASFDLSLRVTEGQPPFQVAIQEVPADKITVGGVTIGGGVAALLDRPTGIRGPGLFSYYSVPSLRSFVMQHSEAHFRLDLETRVKLVEAFKGSKLELTITDSTGVVLTPKPEIEIVNANPNNHFHWRGEPAFLDGWYFKCVHVDAAAGVATPFFFLYGVNDPDGGDGAESFVIYGKAGEAKLGPNLRRISLAPLSLPDPRIEEFWPPDPSKPPDFDFESDYGLDARIPGKSSPECTASDGRCTGTILKDGSLVSWNLKLTKVFPSCKTDWSPLGAMDQIFDKLEEVVVAHPAHMPLMRHLKGVPGVSAYYMSHNMSCVATGWVEWGGKRYDFDRQPAYQDSNWGAEGFPHPYVWMQANHFTTDTGAPDPSTALVALITPSMPMPMPWPSKKVAGICLLHGGERYEFLEMPADSIVEYSKAPDVLVPSARPLRQQIGSIGCTVTFDMGDQTTKVVDMSSATSVVDTLGEFKTRTTKPLPVAWSMTGRNGKGDEIAIEVTCDSRTIMELAAPLDGRMTPAVTKETLLGRFEVKLTPSGLPTTTLVSDFGTAEFGD